MQIDLGSQKNRKVEIENEKRKKKIKNRGEKIKKEKKEKRGVYCYSGITVLACTTNVHWAVQGATRYPLSPSALGCPWRPVLSQHPLPPLVIQSLQIHNL